MNARRFVWMAVSVLLAVGVAPSGWCADWPAYRGNAARSGATSEQLEFPLAPVWVYQPAQVPSPAWPEPGREMHRIDFDYAFQPVIAGGYYVLTGPNGSGKSLLMQALCGLLPPDRGTIRIGGKDVTSLPPRCRNIGYVPQHSHLFPHLSVRRNICFALEAARMSGADIRQRADELANLLDVESLLERAVPGLSGGERQKVALARALANKPELLIMDEPLSEVDEESRNRVCFDLHAVQRETGVTTLHVSHSRRETELLADHIGELRNGRLTAFGPNTPAPASPPENVAQPVGSK